MIDYERAVYDFADRIFHVHAKDLEIRRDGLYRYGVTSLGIGWQAPRLPGLGQVTGAGSSPRSTRSATTRRLDRARGPAFEGEVELVKRGFLIARNALRPYIV